MHTKRNLFWLTLSLVIGIVLTGSSQTTTQTGNPTAGRGTPALIGKWQGSYSGVASGRCEMEFKQDAGGKITGQVAIQPEDGQKSPHFPFDSVSLEGTVLKASFKDPDGISSEIEGKLEKDQLGGNWKSADGSGGTWQTTKVK